MGEAKPVRKGFRDGEKVELYRDKQAQRARSKAARRVKRQQVKVARRGKYGPAGGPSEVIVRRLDGETGEWSEPEVVDPRAFRRRK